MMGGGLGGLEDLAMGVVTDDNPSAPPSLEIYTLHTPSVPHL